MFKEIDDIKKVLNEEEDQILIRDTSFSKPYVILSGSFNPFHIGHNKLLTVAERLSGRNVKIFINVENNQGKVISKFLLFIFLKIIFAATVGSINPGILKSLTFTAFVFTKPGEHNLTTMLYSAKSYLIDWANDLSADLVGA